MELMSHMDISHTNARESTLLFLELMEGGGLTVDNGPFVLDENGFAVLDEAGNRIYLEDHI